MLSKVPSYQPSSTKLVFAYFGIQKSTALMILLKLLCSLEPIGIQYLFQFVSRHLLNQNQRLLIFGK